MKTLLLIISLICAISINAQTKEEIGSTFADLVVQQVDGIGFDTKMNETEIKLVKLQNYFDYELVVLSVNNIIRQYKDIHTYKSWHIYDSGYQIFLMVTDIPIIVQYNTNLHVLIIAY